MTHGGVLQEDRPPSEFCSPFDLESPSHVRERCRHRLRQSLLNLKRTVEAQLVAPVG